jgi:hypothetical protein
VALRVAAELEAALGEPALALLAVQGLADGALALSLLHDPARSGNASQREVASVGEVVPAAPALWSLCAAGQLSRAGLALAPLLPADRREEARGRLQRAADQTARAVAEAEQQLRGQVLTGQQAGVCGDELEAPERERARLQQLRLRAALLLRAAGPVASAALARAAARDPDPAVRDAAAGRPAKE